eukprot:SAG11_NODE_9641_length_893_cov_0.901763_1_plen_137_part_10
MVGHAGESGARVSPPVVRGCWNAGGLEEWRVRGSEGWRVGGLEGRRVGRSEGWKVRGPEGRRSEGCRVREPESRKVGGLEGWSVRVWVGGSVGWREAQQFRWPCRAGYGRPSAGLIVVKAGTDAKALAAPTALTLNW